MSDTHRCPSCRRLLRLPDHLGEAPLSCPACQAVFPPSALIPEAPAGHYLEGADITAEPRPRTGPDWFEPRRLPLPTVLPGRTVAITLVVLLLVHALLDLGASALAAAMPEPASRGDEDILDALAWLTLVVSVPCVVLFCMWMARSYRNLIDLGVEGLQHSPGWAAGAFFVPILNLYRPCQIAQEMWRASDPDTPRDAPLPWTRRGGSVLVALWWAVWMLNHVVVYIAYRMAQDSHARHPHTGMFESLANLVSAAAAVLAVLTILDLRRRQGRKLLRLLEG